MIVAKKIERGQKLGPGRRLGVSECCESGFAHGLQFWSRGFLHRSLTGGADGLQRVDVVPYVL